MSEKKKKKECKRIDALKAAVVAELENCSFHLEFILQTVSGSTDLCDSTFTREGLRLTLQDLQVRIGGIRSSVAVAA
jgi:hypothetical protein